MALLERRVELLTAAWSDEHRKAEALTRKAGQARANLAALAPGQLRSLGPAAGASPGLPGLQPGPSQGRSPPPSLLAPVRTNSAAAARGLQQLQQSLSSQHGLAAEMRLLERRARRRAGLDAPSSSSPQQPQVQRRQQQQQQPQPQPQQQ
jgi:hypothetical protein